MPNPTHIMLLAALAVLGSTNAFASHSSTFSDFDIETDAGWTVTDTSTAPWWGSGNYLGDFGPESVSLGILDALPTGDDGEFGDRLVSLEFDLLLTDIWAGESFQVIANGVPVYESNFFGTETSEHIAISFALFDQSPASTDLIIDFTGSPAIGAWGLDNVNVDWGTPLPAPATLALLGFAVARRRRRG